MFHHPELNEQNQDSRLSNTAKVLTGALVASICGLLITSILASEQKLEPLHSLVQQAIPQSGVENPVTAVLLNFRSFDTLLEIAVILIVAIAMMPQNKAKIRQASLFASCIPAHRNPVLEAFLRWLIPSIVMMSGYLLWTGSYLPGGAFQAGALLAGAGILFLSAGYHQVHFESVAGRWLLTIGLTVFLLVGILVSIETGFFLQYPSEWAGILILAIESAATLSIATILLLLYHSLSRPHTPQSSEEDYL
ncbi:hydrogen gas-evolving membrane-bound hydrogenase subunit E [Algicola sagamiensis]|uniref:hydrogen gas-evolving membrane-bound hydrogenase subunit E n=1 Tax=Algicola sagamiensis TaxID=163869 RepID=UPI0003752B58|nr:hydrogen gas-evolving membrane-bound hydrogenase subunit E [Algicola sagamiensis]